MDTKLLTLTSYELGLAIVFGLLTILITYKLFNRIVLKADTDAALHEGNVAVGILAGITMLSVMLLVQSSISPAVDALHTMMLGGTGVTFQMLMISLGYFLLFYVISLVISLLVVLLVLWLYMKATANIDEVSQVRNGNVAVSMLLSAVILATTLFIKPSVNRFISSLVHYDVLSPTGDPFSAPEDVPMELPPTMPPMAE